MITHKVRDGQFLKDVVAGLAGTPKTLPCKYFYDERGSRLFDAICELDEYYPTRTELAILEQYAGEMAAQIGPTVMLVEPGSGSSLKTRLLLDRLEDPVAYVPVDISCSHLKQMAGELEADYPMLEVLPVCADFTTRFSLPRSRREASHSAVYFPGSTIGNFLPESAEKMLGWMGEVVGLGGGLLIGVDLVKDRRVLEAAYNDQEGVTAQFNLNLLRRINRELGADFDLDGFDHQARYNEHKRRVEMYLISTARQEVSVGGENFEFEEGEEICTEFSHKYTVAGFASLAAGAGFTLRKAWVDEKGYFAVLHLVRMK